MTKIIHYGMLLIVCRRQVKVELKILVSWTGRRLSANNSGRSERSGYSQESLADAAGLHRTYLGGVERGERNISLVNIWRVANALSVSPSELFEPADEQTATDNAHARPARQKAANAKDRAWTRKGKR